MSGRLRAVARHPAFVIAGLLLVANGLRLFRAAATKDPGRSVEHMRAATAGGFIDVSPTWSHDGRRIAFLRVTGQGVVHLCVAPASLSRVVRLFGPETINPDRPLRPGRLGWAAPERIAWSPNDEEIALPRAEWFGFREGYSLPGTALWSYQFRSARVVPLLLHPRRYRGSLFYYRSPAWRADGEGLAAIGEGLLGVTALLCRSSMAARPDSPAVRFDRYLETDWPAWHPTTGRLAFAQGIRRALTAGRIDTIRVIEPGGAAARSVMTVDAASYARQCPEDVARHPGVSIQPRVSGLCWSRDGTAVMYALSPDGDDPGRSSIWSVDARDGGTPVPVRVSAADAYGYAAPCPTGTGSVLAVRTDAGGRHAVELGPQGRERWRCRLASDDFEWSPDGSAVVQSLAEPCRDPARPCMRVSRWSR